MQKSALTAALVASSLLFLSASAFGSQEAPSPATTPSLGDSCGGDKDKKGSDPKNPSALCGGDKDKKDSDPKNPSAL